MIKNIVLLILLSLDLFAVEYYSKIYPFEEYHIKSAVSGEVISVDRSQEGSYSNSNVIIHIDDSLDRESLKLYQDKLATTDESIKLLNDEINNARSIMRIAKESFDRVKTLQSYTKVQKDAKKNAYLSSKNAYLRVKSSLLNQKSIRSDLLIKIANLKNSIKKKNISLKNGEYIYKIYPNRGDFVNFGSRLVDCYDLRRAKLIIYVGEDDIDSIKDKSIYIDGKRSDYKIDKIWKVADQKHLSSYRVEIVIDKPKRFSKLVKVEFK